jgi:hypothetical protein
MLPSHAFWGDFPLVHFDDIDANFTANQLEELFLAANYTGPSQIYPLVKDLLPQLQPPNVPITCLGGSGLLIFKLKIIVSRSSHRKIL